MDHQTQQRNFRTFLEMRNTNGFSLVGLLVAVGIISITSYAVLRGISNSLKMQSKVEAKITANKFQDSLIAAVADRAREFFRDDCSGARWGGVGNPEVAKAFSTLKIDGPDGQTGSLSFIKAGSTPANMDTFAKDVSRCRQPVGPATLPGGGQYAYFCLQFNRDPNDPPSNKNSFWSMDGAIAEITLLPIDLAADTPILCNKVKGARAGVKVQWRTYGVLNNSRISSEDMTKTGFRSSGIFLISGAGTEDLVTPTCSTIAVRSTTTPGTCTVTATQNKGEIYRVTVGSVELPRVNLSTWTGSVPCATGRVVPIRPTATRPGGGPITCSGANVPKN